MSRLKEVWSGQRSLVETFWFWNVLVGNLIIGKGLFFVCKKWAESIQSDFPLYLCLAIEFPYAFWIVVGIYRSGKKHGGLWGWVAIILSVFGAMTNVVVLVSFLSVLFHRHHTDVYAVPSVGVFLRWAFSV
jgi:hypothetical protein